MCRKMTSVALLAVFTGVIISSVSAEILKDYDSGNEVIHADYLESPEPEETYEELQPTDEAKYTLEYIELENDLDPIKEKQDLLQYEEPDELQMENPFELIQSFFSQVFGLTPKKIFMTILHGITYFIATLIFGLSAVTYSI